MIGHVLTELKAARAALERAEALCDLAVIQAAVDAGDLDALSRLPAAERRALDAIRRPEDSLPYPLSEPISARQGAEQSAPMAEVGGPGDRTL